MQGGSFEAGVEEAWLGEQPGGVHAQPGSPLQVAQAVRPTPNPSFRRVDAQVFSEAAAVLRVSTIVGRY